ncbi:hypothetical protein [Lentimicrobium sp. S6]|uniref:hypothetical protein n=1 Tax=Lentimicrobium sp. S6 TaxID=2735872 RepID=UPI00155807D8|nr:hypothetical protein [Lentimicrobium sp. S6]NPD44544.1 hypothetical protein [Lentimicrobium sp. S6]
MRKLLFILFGFPLLALAQPGNYWTNSFNTEASLLSGAVVGGNAEITAIFYNPAGIADIEESRIDLNASLFNLEYKKYTNPLGEGTEMENWVFKVFPRFASYLFQSKRVKHTSFQIAVFNKNSTQTSIYNRVRLSNTNISNQMFKEEYTGLFDLNSKFDDYWGSFGWSTRLNEKWSIGCSINVSVQSLNYFRSATANITPVDNNPITDSIPRVSSNWQSYEKLKAYNWRLIGKLGILYKAKNWSSGLSLTLPSIRLFGDADVNKTVSQSNIFHDGQFIDDFYHNEYPQYVYFKMQDPLSLSVGLRFSPTKSRSEYYFTMEYFMAIKEYQSIDPSRKTSDKSTLGSDFSAYNFGNRQIINFAVGYKLFLKENLGFLAGFRTDFNPYIQGYNPKFWESNGFENLNVDLFHLTGGVNFKYHKAAFVVGLQHSYGFKQNQTEFINFSEPVAYNQDTKLALQGSRKNNMKYSYSSLGFYFSFSVSF